VHKTIAAIGVFFSASEASVTPEAGHVTKLLQAWSRGDGAALDQLTPLVYAELRKLARFHMAQEAPGHTLQATALINEAFLKLLGLSKPDWKNRKHFYGAASQIMRRVLVDYARKRRSVKRGRELKRVEWENVKTKAADLPAVTDVLMFDEALTKLEAIDSRKARVLEAWFFSGMTVEEIAETLEIGTSTVQRDLEFAKVWIARELTSIEIIDEK
jgi:RNA polymerase sigma factor (TIGR02999 family)